MRVTAIVWSEMRECDGKLKEILQLTIMPTGGTL